MSAYKRILVAVDGSDASARGLREAIRLAKAERAELCVFNVVDEFYAFATPEATAEKQGVKAKAVMRETVGGPAADAIVREAKKLRADLIVLGTHGRRGVRRMVLGGDAEQVVRTASVPVLLVRAGNAR